MHVTVRSSTMVDPFVSNNNKFVVFTGVRVGVEPHPELNKSIGHEECIVIDQDYKPLTTIRRDGAISDYGAPVLVIVRARVCQQAPDVVNTPLRKVITFTDLTRLWNSRPGATGVQFFTVEEITNI